MRCKSNGEEHGELVRVFAISVSMNRAVSSIKKPRQHDIGLCAPLHNVSISISVCRCLATTGHVLHALLCCPLMSRKCQLLAMSTVCLASRL